MCFTTHKFYFDFGNLPEAPGPYGGVAGLGMAAPCNTSGATLVTLTWPGGVVVLPGIPSAFTEPGGNFDVSYAV